MKKFLSGLSIRTKLISLALSISIITTTIASLIDYQSEITRYKQNIISNTTADAILISQYCIMPLEFNFPDKAREVLEKLQNKQYIRAASLFNTQDSLVAFFSKVGHPMSYPKTIKATGSLIDDEFIYVYQPVSYKGINYGYLILKGDSNIRQISQERFFIALLLIAGMTLLALSLASLLQRIISEPLIRLTNFTIRIASDQDYTKRIPLESSDEIGKLYNGFNTMLDVISTRERERNQALAAFVESEKRFKTIVDNIPGIVYRCKNDERWTMEFISETVEAITGYSALQLVNNRDLSYSDLVLPDDIAMVTQTIDKAIINRSQFIIEYRIMHRDGSIKWMYEHGQAITDEAGKEVLWIDGVIIDISGRKSAEDEIHRLNSELEQRIKDRTAQLEAANKELEAFSYSVSHDLRAPLRGIDGWGQALVEDYGSTLDEKALTYLGTIRSETQRLGTLIDDMLKLSRVTRTDMNKERIDISNLCIGVIERLRATESDRNIDIVIHPGIIAICDAHLMEIALTNLLGNAWKFTSKIPEPRIEIGYKEEDNERIIFIRDNGVGFDMKYVKKLFGAFQRLHKASEFPGTGIGLATVQRIINRHGGRIWAEAERNQGATFYFTISEYL